MLTQARALLNGLMAALPTSRKPALRRSDVPGFTLATDLPLCADETTVADFVQQAAARGCRAVLSNGWLLLDPVIRVSISASSVVPGDSEAACLISLLHRHPDTIHDPECIRRLARACDAGSGAMARLYPQLHHEWAQRLRRHEPLPDVLPYLLYCCEKRS